MENLKDPAVSFTVILQRKGKIPFCNLSYISYSPSSWQRFIELQRGLADTGIPKQSRRGNWFCQLCALMGKLHKQKIRGALQQ